MEEQIITHVGQKYRVVFEQAASTKGVIGFKCEANGDNLAEVEIDAALLLDYAKAHAPAEAYHEIR